MNTLSKSYLFVSILGLVDALYLSYNRLLGITPPCTTGFFSGCAVVERSPYSVMFGVPLAFYGVLFYVLGIASLLLFAYIKNNLTKYSLLAVSFAGAVSSAYFIYLQAAVIKAFCIYCLFSALCTFALFIIAGLIFKNN